MKGGYVYIMSNKNRTTFYTGVTSRLNDRVREHKEGKGGAFTSRYRCYDLVYYDDFPSIDEALQCEKQIKNWHREWKINLIKSINPDLKDLSDEVLWEFHS